MAEGDLAARMAAFTSELQALAARLRPEHGWYAAFARRHPEQVEAWLAGRELPPWDALADLLQDYAVLHGFAAAERTGWRMRERYEAATRAQDAAPGGRERLARAMALAAEVEREAQQRERLLTAAEQNADRAGQHQEAKRLAALRLWARDDRERALARQSELRARLAAAGARTPPGHGDRDGRPGHRGQDEGGLGSAAGAGPRDAGRDGGHRPVVARRRGRGAGGHRPRGARFAGLDVDETASQGPSGGVAAGGAVPGGGVPGTTPGPPPGPAPAPPPPDRAPLPAGSRFAGAVEPVAPGPGHPVWEERRRVAAATVERLRQLRGRGQGGAAHVVLSKAATGPAERLPLLVSELQQAGMSADLATLLWEVASLPPAALAAAVRELAAAGQERECGQLLWQGAARPAVEAGAVAVALWSAGCQEQAVTLLASLVRARRASEAVVAVEANPAVVPQLLLDAAHQVSPSHHFAVLSELRRAGVA